jgi:hypothetical protein
MFSLRETVFSGKNAIIKDVEEKTHYMPKAGKTVIRYFFGSLYYGKEFCTLIDIMNKKNVKI